jgi:hypothetical protein
LIITESFHYQTVMNKFWYKDELFYYEIDYSKTRDYVDSYISIYKLREGFWRHLSKYKRLLYQEFGKGNFKSDEQILKVYARKLDKHISKIKPIMIDCSKEITTLFSDD